MITAWYLEGINFADAPASLHELGSMARRTVVQLDELRGSEKWEHLLQGKRMSRPKGWVTLEELAETRRGIATGANSFFLISQEAAVSAGIRNDMLLPCIGRANDVEHYIFTKRDFDKLTAMGGKTQLVNLSAPLTPAESKYVAWGESLGLRERYLLANRSPWYSMERREVAPIWAAVFGREDLKFVWNEAKVRSLTNFHCVYPIDQRPLFHRALVACLNADVVRSKSKLQTRVYGGGLSKFEPNDLKAILVPDLRVLPDSTLDDLSQSLDVLDGFSRGGDDIGTSALDQLVAHAGEQAAQKA